MEMTDLFKNAINYTTRDFGKLLIIALVLVGLSIIFGAFTGGTVLLGVATNNILGAIPLLIIPIIIGFVVYLFIEGYMLSVIKTTIENNGLLTQDETFPDFDLKENFVDGLKVFVQGFIYYLIPGIISIIGFLVVGFGIVSSLASSYTSSYSYYYGGGPNPVEILSGASVSLIVVGLIVSFVFTFFTMLSFIARAKLAETGSLSSVFEFEDIFGRISKIGWGRYIFWFIILFIIINALLNLAVFPLFSIASFIGIISMLIAAPFVWVFQSRAIGLLYNES